MTHFHAGVHGSRGPATRQGTKESGVSAHVLSGGARLGVGLHYNATADQDDAAIQISPGSVSGGGTHFIHLPDIDSIIKALNSGDPKIMKTWERIQNEFDKLAYEAHPAVLRTERKRESEARANERERRRLATQRDAILGTLDGAGKLALHKLLDIDWDKHGLPLNTQDLGQDYGNLRYADDGETVLVQARMPGASKWGPNRFTFDLTNCQWVLVDTPDFYGIEDVIGESGYGWRVEEVAA